MASLSGKGRRCARIGPRGVDSRCGQSPTDPHRRPKGSQALETFGPRRGEVGRPAPNMPCLFPLQRTAHGVWRAAFHAAKGYGSARRAPGAFPVLRINERAGCCESSEKPPRSGAGRRAGGRAQGNPRSRAETRKSRVAATRLCPGDCDAATRHGPHALDHGRFAALHPRLFTSCRFAAPVALVPDAITGMHRRAPARLFTAMGDGRMGPSGLVAPPRGSTPDYA